MSFSNLLKVHKTKTLDIHTTFFLIIKFMFVNQKSPRHNAVFITAINEKQSQKIKIPNTSL